MKQKKIGCHTIYLNLPSNEFLVVYDDISSVNLQIVSCIKALKYLRKDYYTLLAHVFHMTQEVKSMKDIPKVCDFHDVFPEDI